jgi:hypothetical protein
MGKADICFIEEKTEEGNAIMRAVELNKIALIEFW